MTTKTYKGAEVVQRPPVYQIPNIIPPGMLELPSFGMHRASAGFTKLPEPDEWKRVFKTIMELQPRSLDTK